MFLLVVELLRLQADTSRSRKAAFSTGTSKNLAVQFKTFLIFCLYFKLSPLPASMNTVSLYAQFLSRSFKAVSSIKNYVNGVRILHLSLDVCFPTLDFSFRLLLRGLGRLKPHEEKHALPVTHKLLRRIFSVLDLTDSCHRALWACYLVSFFLFARKSNVVPPSDKEFDARKHLTRGDIRRSDSGLVVLIKWSKTIQFGERHLLVPLLELPGSPLCPRYAFDFMADRIDSPPEGPAFTFRDTKGGVKSLTHNIMVNSFRQLLRRAGIDPVGYSGHSFRRGGASCAFQAGVPGELIQLHGDWRSDAYLKYLAVPMQHRLQVTHRMRSFILNSGSDG